ncbi:MAG: hypothetical protein NZL85_11880, partial [Fimbriimonadales bacterium]|nr:hypothetical protein [Fimbriimonadales bacterium]
IKSTTAATLPYRIQLVIFNRWAWFCIDTLLAFQSAGIIIGMEMELFQVVASCLGARLSVCRKNIPLAFADNL